MKKILGVFTVVGEIKQGADFAAFITKFASAAGCPTSGIGLGQPDTFDFKEDGGLQTLLKVQATSPLAQNDLSATIAKAFPDFRIDTNATTKHGCHVQFALVDNRVKDLSAPPAELTA